MDIPKIAKQGRSKTDEAKETGKDKAQKTGKRPVGFPGSQHELLKKERMEEQECKGEGWDEKWQEIQRENGDAARTRSQRFCNSAIDPKLSLQHPFQDLFRRIKKERGREGKEGEHRRHNRSPGHGGMPGRV
ncbi:predicted protein [Chaetomium globosum CBS 148.51]|uniref:Uncharacterized protein n=1 Tax=Chaetomium globosum (strain ATCC 6205 / CBS 148.51 / DSM 1962 / NBRC 6347 / NRRL 1970) TaxID=306901 RepID=Q2HDG8_CHAGB|nr:uncharacterized protein CHGG_01736 [Chaetomium globosum CBS 148.51]EAQ93501.1 predicted protein [Chaetomium globosum CBS 148.51]